MKLDLGSFAFGSSVVTGGNTPSWGTSLGQQRPDLKFTYPGYDNIIIGMMYKSIPINKVFIPLGKGGHVCNSLEDEGIQLAAMFDKVYINEVKVDAPFIMLIYQDGSDSWAGRRTLKYNTKIEYRRGQNDIIYNSTFVTAAKAALQLADDACWVVSDMHIVNQDELHLIAGVVNPNHSESYPSAELRKAAFIDAIKTTYDKHPNFAKKYSSENSTDLSSQEILLDTAIQIIFYGAPGTGKSHEIKDQIKKHKSFRITFHPDTDYSSFVGAYKPTSVEVPMLTPLGDKAIPMKDVDGNELTENKIIYTYVKQAFLNAYIEAWKERANENPQPVFLVIEEINRGNCAQIFGDIFQLLDRNDAGFSDYAIVPDTDLSRHVKKDLEKLVITDREKINAIYEECEADMVDKVLNGEVLLLPNNLYIWATMNTSDQSLFPIDSAFKRRWDWKYIKIANAQKNWQIKVGTKNYDWWQFVQAINYFVFDATQSEDKNLGYFFAKAKNGIINADTFVSKVIFYLYTDVFKDYGFSGDIFKGTNGEEMTFQSFYNIDGSANEAQIACFIENVIYSDALPETLKIAESVEEQGNESNGKKKKLVIKFPDGTIIKETTQFASYLKALEKIGLDKAEHVASSKRYSRLDCPLISKTQYDAILDNTQGFSYVNVGDYYIIKGIIVGTMNDLLNQISTELDLGIISSIETSAE